MSSQQVLSQPETIGLLLARSKRPDDMVPIRNTFLQQGTQSNPTPGPLKPLVERGDDRALELFLLAHAVASGGDRTITEWSFTWSRGIGVFNERAGRVAVSRAWHRLEMLNLISRSRGTQGRTQVTVLREDGSGKRYQHPHAKEERYFKLPFEYWLGPERWHQTLTMPAKAMLFVALSLTQEEFPMPQDKVPRWYGWSADSAGRGLRALQSVGLLTLVREEYVPSLDSRTGYAARHIYKLNPPFDLQRRFPRKPRPATRRAKPKKPKKLRK
jgi:hypothetical protein